MAFRFRLQRVLDLRARAERDAATALVSAQEAADAARDAQRQLERQRAELAARMVQGMAAPATDAASDVAPDAAPVGTSVGALRNFAFLLDRLDERVATAAASTQAAEQAVGAREDALRAAFRDRRTLDRLRERHQDAWRATEAAKDRTLMDEIALTRFTTTAAGDASGAPTPEEG